MSVDRRTAVVTGGAQGIGKGIVRALLAAGWRVALGDSDLEAGGETLAELTPLGDVRFCPVDVADSASVQAMAAEVLGGFGGLDLLVNNAGIMIRKPLVELTPDEWQRVLGVNLTGAFLCARAFAGALSVRHGSIVNIASTRALMSEPDTEAYAASKGGLVALTHALAVSLGPRVRVNSISPGWIDVSDWKKQSRRRPEILTPQDHAQHPSGRVGTPEDVASLVLWFADPANAFVTGQNFIVDGGMTRKMIYC